MTEAIFIRSLIENPNKIVTLSKEVSSFDFIDQTYYFIYKEILKNHLGNKDIDFPTLRFIFKDQKEVLLSIDESEKQEVVHDLQLIFDQLIEQSTRKKIKDLAKRVIDSEDDLVYIKQEIDMTMLKIHSQSNLALTCVADIEESLVKNIQEMREKYSKTKNLSQILDLPSGIEKLDHLTFGLQRQNCWCIAGTTGAGKTQLAIQIVNNILQKGKKVLYFMLEDTKENLLQRLVVLNTRIPMNKLRVGDLTDKEFTKFNNYISRLRIDNNLFISDDISEINTIINKIKFAKLIYPDLDAVVIDSYGLSHDYSQKFSNREQELSTISTKLMDAAKATNVAFIVLAQVNSNPTSRSNQLIPFTLDDVRDSRKITHDSPVCIFIHYPKKRDDGLVDRTYAQLLLLKNRYGEVNKIINLNNKAYIGKFEDAPEIDTEQLGEIE